MFPASFLRGLVAATAVALCTVVTAGAVLLLSSEETPAPPRAAFLDQLAVTDPNPELAEYAVNRLAGGGYETDYYPWNAITVDVYRELPRRSYDIVVMRSHSSGLLTTIDPVSGSREHSNNVTVFTNEPFNAAVYPSELQRAELSQSTYPDRGIAGSFFSFGKDFVRERMEGRLDGTIIILMGCGGLSTPDLARAFLDRGADAFVGWDGEVTAAHVDIATASLLDNLLLDGRAIAEAVQATRREIGPDPSFGSALQLLAAGE